MKSFNLLITFRSLLSLLIVLLASAAFAQAPKTLSYQGKLSDGGGPLNGTYNLTFTLYDAATGGSSVWTETSTNVSITSGNLSLILGKTTPINVASDKPLWLGIKVGANPEVTPRVEMTGSLYSLGVAFPIATSMESTTPMINLTNSGTGRAGQFMISNSANNNTALYTQTSGTGSALTAIGGSPNGNGGIFHVPAGNGLPLNAYTFGTSNAAIFSIANASNSNAAVSVSTNGTGNAIMASTFGTGNVATFSNANSGNNSPVISITNSGTGNAITANRPIQATQFIGDGSLLTNLPGGFSLPYSNETNTSIPILRLTNSGQGSTAVFFGSSASTSTLQAQSTGGSAFSAFNSGTLGTAGEFVINNASNTANALYSLQAGRGRAGEFSILNTSNSSNVLLASTNGTGGGINLSLNNAANFNPAININHSGTGNAITANRPIQATQFIGDGSLLTNLAGDNFGNHEATQNILPNSNGLLDIGSSSNLFKNVFIGGGIYRGTTPILRTTNNAGLYIGKNAGIVDVATARGFYGGPATGNMFIGEESGLANTTGYANHFIGYRAGFANTTGAANLIIGHSAGYNNTTGNQNFFIGVAAGFYNTTGSNNYFLGLNAGLNNTTGGENLALGWGAGHGNVTGNRNTYIGGYTGFNNPTGIGNVTLGFNSGQSNQYTNSLFLGYESGTNGSGVVTNASAIGYNAKVTGSNMIRLGDANVTVIQGQVGFTAASDQRFKKDIHSLNEGLDFILKLKPVSYKMKSDGGGKTNWGFIAQDIEKLLGTENAILTIGGDKERMLGLRYSDFVAPLTKAVQEQQQTIESLKAEIASMKTQHQTEVVKLEAENTQLKSDIESRLKKMETMLGMKADATTTTKAKE